MKAKILKPVLLVLAAILLVVASVLGTMAYMTTSSAVSNVFTVGNVSINMSETKVDSDGVPTGDGRTDSNSYRLSPANTYLKDPRIDVAANCDESYLFVRMRNDLKTIECKGGESCNHKVNPVTNMIQEYVGGALVDTEYSHSTMLQQLIANGWQEIERADSNIDAVFVFVGAGHAYDVHDPANEDLPMPEARLIGGANVTDMSIPVFHNFTLACEVDNLPIYGGARVALVAYAIQADLNDGNDPGSPVGYKAAWEYVKAELPFVV